MFGFRRKAKVKGYQPGPNYKPESRFTKDDYLLIEADRRMTGIGNYTDEYYYNHILFNNEIPVYE